MFRRHTPPLTRPWADALIAPYPLVQANYDRVRGNLDRHGVHFLTAYVAGV
jgi:hypothetical protein